MTRILVLAVILAAGTAWGGPCDSEFRELLEAAEGVQDRVGESTDTHWSTLEYRTPAMRLREQADQIDRHDAAVARFRAAIRKARECAGK